MHRVALALAVPSAAAFVHYPGPWRPNVQVAMADWSAGSMVAAQDDYGNWYAAEVLQTDQIRGYKVHYVGWEDYWDEWLDESKLAQLPDERPQTDVDLSPEVLAARREVALQSNDIWQFAQFAETFEGSFTGRTEWFGADGKATTTTDGAFSVVREDIAGESAHESWCAIVDSDMRLTPSDFRGDSERDLDATTTLGGTAANVNAFTTATKNQSTLVCDLWLRRGIKLLGLRVFYDRRGDAFNLSQAMVSRLLPAAIQKNIFPDKPEVGDGIRDPHPHLSLQPTLQLQLQDKVTCAFPTSIQDDARGVVRHAPSSTPNPPLRRFPSTGRSTTSVAKSTA